MTTETQASRGRGRKAGEKIDTMKRVRDTILMLCAQEMEYSGADLNTIKRDPMFKFTTALCQELTDPAFASAAATDRLALSVAGNNLDMAELSGADEMLEDESSD